MNLFPRLMAVTMLGAVAMISGCGQSGPARSPVAGKVTLDGQPVKGGSLTFAPITTEANAPSAPVIAKVKDDGTFEVAGGAVAGKQRVMYDPPPSGWVAPEWDGKGAPPQEPPSPYANMAPKNAEVDFTSTANDITIELQKKL